MAKIRRKKKTILTSLPGKSSSESSRSVSHKRDRVSRERGTQFRRVNFCQDIWRIRSGKMGSVWMAPRNLRVRFLAWKGPRFRVKRPKWQCVAAYCNLVTLDAGGPRTKNQTFKRRKDWTRKQSWSGLKQAPRQISSRNIHFWMCNKCIIDPVLLLPSSNHP